MDKMLLNPRNTWAYLRQAIPVRVGIKVLHGGDIDINKDQINYN